MCRCTVDTSNSQSEGLTLSCCRTRVDFWHNLRILEAANLFFITRFETNCTFYFQYFSTLFSVISDSATFTFIGVIFNQECLYIYLSHYLSILTTTGQRYYGITKQKQTKSRCYNFGRFSRLWQFCILTIDNINRWKRAADFTESQVYGL